MSTRNVEQEFDTLKMDFGKLSSDLVSLTQSLRELTGRSAEDYAAKLRAGVGHATDEVEAAAAALKTHGCEGMAVVARQMRERPLASILIGFGLGVLIGNLVVKR